MTKTDLYNQLKQEQYTTGYGSSKMAQMGIKDILRAE